jgi:hypothetical protein
MKSRVGSNATDAVASSSAQCTRRRRSAYGSLRYASSLWRQVRLNRLFGMLPEYEVKDTHDAKCLAFT